MRVTLKTGIIFAFAWMLIKLSLFGMGMSSEKSFLPSLFLNMFFLILAITIGLYLQKRKDTEQGNALKDIKNGMTSGFPYAILVSFFIYIYYSKIDPAFIQGKIADREVFLDKTINDPKQLQKLRDSNPDYEVMTVKQIRKIEIKNGKSAVSAGNNATMTILALLLYAMFNSIFITIILRKIVFKNSNQAHIIDQNN